MLNKRVVVVLFLWAHEITRTERQEREDDEPDKNSSIFSSAFSAFSSLVLVVVSLQWIQLMAARVEKSKERIRGDILVREAVLSSNSSSAEELA